MVTFAAGCLALGLFPSLPAAVFGLFADAFGGILRNIVTVPYRQRTIPADILGRVNSIYRFFGSGMMPVGALADCLLVRLAEPALGREAALLAPFSLAGIVTLALTVYGFFRIRFPE